MHVISYLYVSIYLLAVELNRTFKTILLHYKIRSQSFDSVVLFIISSAFTKLRYFEHYRTCYNYAVFATCSHTSNKTKACRKILVGWELYYQQTHRHIITVQNSQMNKQFLFIINYILRNNISHVVHSYS